MRRGEGDTERRRKKVVVATHRLCGKGTEELRRSCPRLGGSISVPEYIMLPRPERCVRLRGSGAILSRTPTVVLRDETEDMSDRSTPHRSDEWWTSGDECKWRGLAPSGVRSTLSSSMSSTTLYEDTDDSR
eukprot:Sspe_Gene.96588::Locus_69461_Transcript_1_1_Confidence_1.000_Length_1844::g.96588::m.96588